MKPPTRNIGINWLIVSSTPVHRYQNVQQPGDPSYPGVRTGPPTTTGALLITTKTTMRTKTTTTTETTNQADATNPPITPTSTPPTQATDTQPPPSYPIQTQTMAQGSQFCAQVGHSMFHSLRILGLELGASVIEIKVHYQQLACKYHLDKNDPAVTGLTATEASHFFKLLNNAQKYLKECALLCV
jgi:hypothetical protein